MTKRATLLMLLLSSILSQELCAQMDMGGNNILYGNEWIDYNQSYFEIKVPANGIYKISQSELSAAGVFSQSSVPTGANFQLFYRGEEVPIYVSTSGAFTGADYIEFHGIRNDGWMDQFLYVEADMHPNPEYSMFSDESTYFLTWNNSTNNDRYTDYNYTLPSGIAKEDYCWYTETEIYNNTFNRGETFSGSTSTSVAADGISSRYYTAEGYSSSTATSHAVSLSTPFPYTSGGDATITTYLNTESGNHQVSFDLGATNYTTPVFSGWEVRSENFTSPANTIGTSTTVNIQNANEFRLASVSIEYARTFNFGNEDYFEFALNSSVGNQYIEITNFNASATNPVLYDLTNQRRIVATYDAGTIKAVLPPSATKRNCVLVSASNFSDAGSIEENDFYPFDFDSGKFNYIIISGDPLFDDGNGTNYIQEYANYRDTLSGFDYRPLVVDVAQLYDQFGYGVERHEQSIKNFLKQASLSNSWDVKHLFIIGKGKEKRSLRNGATSQFDIVPTFGYPHSDYAFVMDHTSVVPWMSVGRLAAYTPNQVRIYLEKMQSYEAALNSTPQTVEEKEWMKNILHFGGGDATIQGTIQTTLNNLTDIVEPSTFGGDVTNFFTGGGEGSADADLAIDYINDGTSLITFFGHSAPNTVDFDIGAPEDYDSNVDGSFPLFYAIGCNTNRVFDFNSTLSEDYVLIEDKGAIGWYGNTWITFLSSLVPLAENFYENMSTDNYGETFGEIFVQSLAEFDPQVVSNSANELVALSSMLHGDPAIRLHPHPRPDFVVDESLSATSPKLVALQDDTITLNLEIANIGRFNNEMLTIDLEHFDPSSNSVYTNQITVDAPANSSNYTIKIPFSGETSLLGLNQLSITLDQANSIAEETNGGEANNQATLSFFVVESDIKPSTPTEFSIFPGGLLTLKASTIDAPSNLANYYFEIDTTENFDSPLLKTTVVNAEGGVVEWEPNVTLINNTVYYWRVSAGENSSDVSLDWKNSSFTYMLGSAEGWNQQHNYQYQRDELDNFDLEAATGRFDYSKSKKKIKVVNGPRSVLLWIEQVVFEDGFKTDMNNFPCSNGGKPVDGITIPANRINVFIYNRNTLTIQERIPAPNCWGEDEDRWKIDWHMFDPKNATSRERWIDLIESIDEGDYVVISNAQSSSGGSYGVADWAMDSTTHPMGKNIFQVLEGQGLDQVRTLEQNEHSFIFAFQKDNPDFLPVQNIGAEPNDFVEARTTITGKSLKGVMTSTMIGPANSWSSVQWQASEVEANDTTYIKVYGVSADQQTRLLLDSTFSNSYSLVGLDATQYPFLQLEYISKDSIDRTAAQLDRWRVFYEPAPDLAVAPNVSYSFNSPSLSLGDDLMLDFTVSNLSSTAVANAVDVEVTIVDSTGAIVAVKNETLPALGANASSVLSLSYNTDTDLGLSEDNRYGVIVQINKNKTPLEVCYLNNDMGIIEFLIQGCLVNRTITSSETFSGITTVKVSNVITAENVIEAGANVIYSAGTLIHLMPGFHAEANSTWHGFLGGCSLTPPSLVEDSDDEAFYENEVDGRSAEVEQSNRVWNNLKINIIPNPVSDQAQVKFFLPETDKVNIMISDLNGRIVTALDAMEVQQGWNISRFSAGNLSSGIYLVIIQSERGVAVERFSIQK